MRSLGTNVRFIEPMLLQRAERLPEGAAWLYELKLDGFRAQAVNNAGRVQLLHRRPGSTKAKSASRTRAWFSTNSSSSDDERGDISNHAPDANDAGCRSTLTTAGT
jgi:hypothetical protein